MSRGCIAEGNRAEICADRIARIFRSKDVLEIRKTSRRKVRSADTEREGRLLWLFSFLDYRIGAAASG
jgi:hypothetical protein